MKESFQKCCHFAFIDKDWGNYLGHLTAFQVHHDCDHNRLGTVYAKDAPLARFPKSISVQSLSSDKQSEQDVVLFYRVFRVKPGLASVAACGLLFLSASSQQALSKTTVIWIMTQINYNGCLHRWTGNRQAVSPFWLLRKMYPPFICLVKLIRTFFFSLINGKKSYTLHQLLSNEWADHLHCVRLVIACRQC